MVAEVTNLSQAEGLFRPVFSDEWLGISWPSMADDPEGAHWVAANLFKTVESGKKGTAVADSFVFAACSARTLSSSSFSTAAATISRLETSANRYSGENRDFSKAFLG
eukprot:Gregarina_sp_Poly_1__977@NODE_1239_length_4674_cov_201_846538_g844_i0_p5_GENE_NODE_1239_length_4674_cov_201_846538_g844_i0NODE_1239_length_4674_cov_201_846538_g844_i0_p5_ORF_typecomplete_len108_score12_02Glyco_transf_11/PF01531_16/0_13DUF4592/PF15262_6/0_2_NODE_1239_length_4674_cov_201_846538_g844_i016832006